MKHPDHDEAARLLQAAMLAEQDQQTAGDQELAARVAAYRHALVDQGVPPEEALALAVYFQQHELTAPEG